MSNICRCKSHTGKQKFRYKSFDHADRAATDRGWKCDVYPCPYRKHTYHLTHRKQKDNQK